MSTYKEDTELSNAIVDIIYGKPDKELIQLVGSVEECYRLRGEVDKVQRMLALINRETVKAQEDLITRLNDKYPHLPSIEDIAANVVSENRDWVISVLFEFDLFGGELHRTKEQLQGEQQ